MPHFADWCLVDLHPDATSYRRLVVAHEGDDRNELLQRLIEEAPSETNGSEWEQKVLNGEPVLLQDPDASALRIRRASPAYSEALEQVNPASILSVPMQTRHGVVGIITVFMAESGRHFTDTAQHRIGDLAHSCAMAIENATLYGEAQEALQERADALDLLQSIFGGSAVGLAFLDPYLRMKFANREFARLGDVALPSLEDQPFVDSIPLLSAHLAPMVEKIARGTSESAELEFEVEALVPRVCMATCHAVRGASSELVGIGLVITDITERRIAESAREQSEDRLRMALDAARMGMWHWNADDSNMVHWSAMTGYLLGLEGASHGSVAEFFSRVAEEDRDSVRIAAGQALANGSAFELEFKVRWTDHTEHYVLTKGHAVSTGGRLTGLTGIILDITEQRAQLDAGARLAQRQARAGELAVKMQRVTARLSESTTVDDICAVLVREGVNVTQADKSIVYMLREREDVLERTITTGFRGSLAMEYFDVHQSMPVSDAVRTGQPYLAGSRENIAEPYPQAMPFMEAHGVEALAVFPLRVNGRSIGAWALMWDDIRTFEEGDLIIFLTIASQAAQAIERARLYERERFIATALQRTLLPASLPSLSGATTARRYLPSAAGVEVGGDWYDVLRLPGNRVALVIGDVGGHNIDAAAVMGQLRNAIRSYAWEGHPAGKVLESTNKLLCGLEPGVMATCCYLELNLDDGIASVAVAGHPPPLVIEPVDGAAFMEVTADPPLGAEVDHVFEQASLFLEQGQSIALYTDGLVESRRIPIEHGMERLLVAAADALDRSPEGLADRLIDVATSENVEDDMALLVLRWEPVATNREDVRLVRRELPSTAASAGVARRFAVDVMEDWGADDVADTVALCVSELVTNALIHTATGLEIVLRLDEANVRVDVIDHSDRMPAMRASGDEATTGRGLHIVEAITSDWGVELVESGKSVWFRIDRSETVL